MHPCLALAKIYFVPVGIFRQDWIREGPERLFNSFWRRIIIQEPRNKQMWIYIYIYPSNALQRILLQQYVPVRHSSVYRRFYGIQCLLLILLFIMVSNDVHIFPFACDLNPFFLLFVGRTAAAAVAVRRALLSEDLSIYLSTSLYVCIGARSLGSGVQNLWYVYSCKSLLFHLEQKKKTDEHYYEYRCINSCYIRVLRSTTKKRFTRIHPELITSIPFTTTVRTYSYLYY